MGWREDVEQALRNQGGEADLSEIYREIERLRPGSLGPTWQSTVRGTLEAHSSDSRVWKPTNPDVFRRITSGRWGLRPSEPAEIGGVINALSKENILAAIQELDSGVEHKFGESVRYDVLYNGKRYAPKAVVGLAAKWQLGRPLSPEEFSGGLHSRSFRALEKNGFQIVEKGSGGLTLSSPLPEAPAGSVWIEFLSDHNHGGSGWEFGTCLWSPSRSSDGKDWFSPMRAVKAADLIVHVSIGEFVGFSYAKDSYREVSAEPPEPDRWRGMAPYYRIELRDYTGLPVRASVQSFLERFKNEIRQDRARPDREKFYPFVVQSGSLRKFEGAYLSPCSPELYQLIRRAVSPAGSVGRPGPIETPRQPKFWAMGLGEQGRLWNECQEQGIIAIGWDYLGDLSRYADQDAITRAIVEHEKPDAQPTNQSLCCWQFVHDMGLGDFVVAKIGRSRILGVGVVESNYDHRPSRHEYQNVRGMKWLKAKTLELPEDALLTTKTLTEISDYEKVISFVRENYLEETPSPPEPLEPYTVDQALTGLFVPRREFEAMLEALRTRKNVILQGPPGVGKTFVAKRLAWALVGFRDERRVQMVQFHQSYAYEDFIQGWRPTAEGGFRLRSGVFYEFCNRARVDLGMPYVFVIDEINRGNLSKIFGELMMLIEPDKRGADYAIPLTYSETGEQFSVPENVYLLGLMNTADRSLAMVDYALRRRFRFVELRPQFDQTGFADHLKAHGASNLLVNKIINRVRDLNAKIEADHKNLGRGFVVGHSFFCLSDSTVQATEEWYQQVVRCEVAPLIEEYWFDRPARAKEWIDKLLVE